MKMPLLTLIASLTLANPAWAVTVSAVGDIMMGTDYPAAAALVNGDFFKFLRPIIKNDDIRFGNLEGTLFDGPAQDDGKAGGANRYLFRTPTPMVSHLKNAGFNVLSLANNHARDFGRAGLESTKRTLSLNQIQYSSKDGEVSEFNINGTRVALIATDFYPGRRSITSSAATLEEIRMLKQRFAIVIVSAHAGGEGVGAEHVYNRKEIFLGENRGNSVEFARQAVEAGADLILMHGPHVPRGLEVHNDRLIAYSLGNFVTERGININGYAGLAPLLEVEMDRSGRFKSGKITSFKQIRGQPVRLDPAQQAFRLMSQVSRSDFPNSAPSFSGEGFIYPFNAKISGLRP